MAESGQTEGEPTADVVVVGYGPVGATVAGLAARQGRSVVVVDRERDIFPLPRAAHCDHETLRILQELGCAEPIVEAMVENPGMDFLSADHEILIRLVPPTTTASGWPASVLFHQPGFEGEMRKAVEAAGVDLRLGVGVARVSQDETGATAHLDDGTEVRGRYLVACDGARSGVRRQLGITLDDLEFEEPWLVVDLFLHEPIDSLPDRALQVCDPARPHTLVPMPFPRFRFEFMLLPGEQAEEMQQVDVVRDLLRPWLDPDLVDLERSAVYVFHGLIADRWREGRIFLAGDAAHQTPPFLGQGMCSGMRDAANLVWKLGAVLDGVATDALLDTYEPERSPHVRKLVELAVGFGRIICTLDPEEAEARNAGMLAGDRESEQPVDTPELGDSAALGIGGGSLAFQPMLDGQRLDDVVGARWALVTRDPLEPSSLDGRGVPAERVWCGAVSSTPALAPLLADAEAVVVRPDRYVGATGTVDEVLAYLEAVHSR